MSDSNASNRALTPSQEFNKQLDAQVENFKSLLPSHVSVDKFKRVVIVAISQNPALFRADRRSFFTAAQKCASDGLIPDGRQAALVPFGDQVQYLPMVAGIRQRMRNSGDVLSAEAHVVYRNDKFFQKFGDDPAIVHEPPAFGVDRGDPVGAYAIIRLKNGEVLREVMDRHQINRVRSFSKSKDGPAWTNWWDEMARKTVLRRCAKGAPSSADIDNLLARDDEAPESGMVDITPPETEPLRANELSYRPQPEQPDSEPEYLVIDCDGEEIGYRTREKAAAALDDVFHEATRRGKDHLEAAIENNAMVMSELGIPQPDSPAGTVHPMTAQHSAASPAGETDTPAGNGYRAKQSRNARKDASLPDGGTAAPAPASTPAGDTMPDMFTGESRRPRSLHVALQDETSEGWGGWRLAMWALIEAKEPPVAILSDNRENLVIFEQIDPDEHGKIMRALGSK